MGASIRTIKENTEASVFVSNEIGLEINYKKSKYMVMSQDMNAVQNHNIYKYKYIYIYVYIHRRVPGGMCQTSGGCSLC